MQITELILRTNNISRQLRFYTGQLGMPGVHQSAESFSIRAGKSILTFQSQNNPLPSVYHFAFNVATASLTGIPAFLDKNDISPIVADNVLIHEFTDWNARAVYFKDPDGNILEFIARFNLYPSDPVRAFSVEDIFSISEMGIVVYDLPGFVEVARKHLHQDIWKEYGPDFKAIGDEEGLLITVPPHRNWFPTNSPALPMPASITLEREGLPLQYDQYHFTQQLLL
jgi:catechol 2,3-dioxygenase-like lactoylglutathione lyase family enzyme